MKKIPMRMDIVTHEMFPKKDLVRIVKDKNSDLIIDSTGKVSGRGVYISLNIENIKKVKKNKSLDKIFQTEISESFYDELINYIEHKVARNELFRS